MKNILKTLVVAFTFIASNMMAQGPDAFGYTWKDNYNSTGPSYSWVDIAQPGKEVLALGDDNVIGPFPMFNFIYYWYPVDEFYIGSNGYISFGNINIASPFPYIPDSLDNKHNFIAPLMSDLNFTGTANPGECYYSFVGDSLIVSWIDVPFWNQSSPSYTGQNTFQIVLNKQDKSITFNYKAQSGLTMNSDVTIGIENNSGTIGLQHSKNILPTAGYTIKFYYPSNPSYLVTDGSAEWNGQSSNRGEFLPYSIDSFPLIANIANLGNQDIPSYVLNASVSDLSQIVLHTSNKSVSDTLRSGKDTTLTYPDGFLASSPTTYSYSTILSGIINDAIISNDTAIQELVVIDTTAPSMNLSYANGMPSGLGISWSGGTGGIGVYFEPPVYPARITDTRFIISSNPNNASFDAKIYDDDGDNGGPGTLLDSVTVTSSTIILGNETTVSTASNVVVYDGGVYVLWDMNGENVTLANDINPPFSFHTYEVLGGTWAEYRSNESSDFFISLDIEKHFIEDVGATTIDGISDGAIIDTQTQLSCWIKNFGQYADASFDVNYDFGSSAVITEAYVGPNINPGDSALFTFNTLLFDTMDTSGVLCVWTTKGGDYDHTNDTTCLNISVDVNSSIENVELNVGHNVYPNPARDYLTIEFSNPDLRSYDLLVYDILGKNWLDVKRIKTNQYFIKASNLPSGSYLYSLKSKEQTFNGRFFIK
jgi:hypothetical protein